MKGYYHLKVGLLLQKLVSVDHLQYYEAKDIVIYTKQKNQYIIISGGRSGMTFDINDSEYQIFYTKELDSNLLTFFANEAKRTELIPSYYYKNNSNQFMKIINNDLINNLKERTHQEEKVLFLDDYRRRLGS